jgi:hypothetical protein
MGVGGPCGSENGKSFSFPTIDWVPHTHTTGRHHWYDGISPLRNRNELTGAIGVTEVVVGPRLRLRYERGTQTRVIWLSKGNVFKNYFYIVFAILPAASQHTFHIPRTPTPTPSVQHKDRPGHAVQIADVTRCTWDGPLTRRVGFVQSGHREACRGCFAASDCRESLPGCRLWQEGRRFYDRPPPLPSAG